MTLLRSLGRSPFACILLTDVRAVLRAHIGYASTSGGQGVPPLHPCFTLRGWLRHDQRLVTVTHSSIEDSIAPKQSSDSIP